MLTNVLHIISIYRPQYIKTSLKNDQHEENAMANKYVFSCTLKVCTDSASRTYKGKLFLRLGATATNARSPFWLNLVLGTLSKY